MQTFLQNGGKFKKFVLGIKVILFSPYLSGGKFMRAPKTGNEQQSFKQSTRSDIAENSEL